MTSQRIWPGCHSEGKQTMITKVARTPNVLTSGLSVVAVLAGLLCWRPAPAAELGFYVGGAYGNGKKTIGRDFFDDIALNVYDAVGFTPTLATATSSIETKNPGYGFVAGYRLFPHLAVEGGYLDLGKVRYFARSDGSLATQDGTSRPATLDMSLNAKTGGFALSALGILPVSYRWELYGRAGVMFASNQLTLFVTDGVGSIKEKFTGSSTDFLVGAGASYTFAEIYALRAEFQRVFDAGDDTVGEGDVDLITVGVTVQF
jgi:OOP family OmpA-OmpF porin